MFFKFNRKSRLSPKSQRGVALLEALISVAILAVVGSAFFGNLSAMLKADFIANERSRAQSYALSEMESIKSQSYIDFSILGHPTYSLIALPASHTIALTVSPINPATGLPLNPGLDSGVQKITLVVSHLGTPVITLEGYKVRK